MPPTFSIIICTAMRPTALRDCLSSVLHQTISPSQYEVIVINNAPENDLQVRAVLTEMAGPAAILYAVEEDEGLSPARNRGISIATGQVLVFIDDDAIAPPSWLEELQSTYRTHPDAAVVGGRIRLRWQSKIPAWLHPQLYDYLGQLDYGDGDSPIQRNQRLGGGNFSMKRSWISTCGPFCSRLGRNQVSLLSGEEIELIMRIRAQGGQCYYAAKAVVYHTVATSRLNRTFFKQRAYWGARSEARIDAIHFHRMILRKLLARFVRLPYHFFFSVWYRLTDRQSLACLWETFYWGTLGYSIEVVHAMAGG